MGAWRLMRDDYNFDTRRELQKHLRARIGNSLDGGAAGTGGRLLLYADNI
jgi:hypothetical protein